MSQGKLTPFQVRLLVAAYGAKDHAQGKIYWSSTGHGGFRIGAGELQENYGHDQAKRAEFMEAIEGLEKLGLVKRYGIDAGHELTSTGFRMAKSLGESA